MILFPYLFEVSIPEVTGTYTNNAGLLRGDYEYTSENDTQENNPLPYLEDLSITNDGTGALGDTFTANYTFISPSGYEEGATTFQWYRADENLLNTVEIEGATSQNYVATEDDVDKILICAITPVQSEGGNTIGELVSVETESAISGEVEITYDQEIYINMRYFATAYGVAPWYNEPSYDARVVGEVVADLLNSINTATGVSLSVQNAFSQQQVDSRPAPTDGALPQLIIEKGWGVINSAGTATLRLSGLDNTKIYDIYCYGHCEDIASSSLTQVECDGVVDTYIAELDTGANPAELEGLTPSEGILDINISAPEPAGIAAIVALVIKRRS